jgi:hypothetical protein
MSACQRSPVADGQARRQMRLVREEVAVDGRLGVDAGRERAHRAPAVGLRRGAHAHPGRAEVDHERMDAPRSVRRAGQVSDARMGCRPRVRGDGGTAGSSPSDGGSSRPRPSGGRAARTDVAGTRSPAERYQTGRPRCFFFLDCATQTPIERLPSWGEVSTATRQPRGRVRHSRRRPALRARMRGSTRWRRRAAVLYNDRATTGSRPPDRPTGSVRCDPESAEPLGETGT